MHSHFILYLGFCSNKADQIPSEATLYIAILCCQYHACWCPGDLRSQGISRYGIDQISCNILSVVSEELIKNLEFQIKKSVLVQVMAWWLTGHKQLIEPMLTKITINEGKNIPMGKFDPGAPRRCDCNFILRWMPQDLSDDFDLDVLDLLVLKLEYCRKSRSIPWLLMPWFLHPKTSAAMAWSSVRKAFKYRRHIRVEKL